MAMDLIQKRLLREVADLHDVPEGAYNIIIKMFGTVIYQQPFVFA